MKKVLKCEYLRIIKTILIKYTKKLDGNFVRTCIEKNKGETQIDFWANKENLEEIAGIPNSSDDQDISKLKGEAKMAISLLK